VNSNVNNEIYFVEARNDNSKFISPIQMLYSIIILILCICVIQSLKCHKCQFDISFNDVKFKEHISSSDCYSDNDQPNGTLCRSVVAVDYLNEKTMITLGTATESDEEDSENKMQFVSTTSKETTEFRFQMSFKPFRVFSSYLFH
jgi:hypothetical protein